MEMSNDPCALVVEDDFMTAMNASAILRDCGFRPIDAVNAAQALGLLSAQGEDVQIMLTDVRMPGTMNGFQLARKVSMEWPHIRIFVASGLEWPEFGDLPAQATFVFKPLSAEIMARVLSD